MVATCIDGKKQVNKITAAKELCECWKRFARICRNYYNPEKRKSGMPVPALIWVIKWEMDEMDAINSALLKKRFMHLRRFFMSFSFWIFFSILSACFFQCRKRKPPSIRSPVSSEVGYVLGFRRGCISKCAFIIYPYIKAILRLLNIKNPSNTIKHNFRHNFEAFFYSWCFYTANICMLHKTYIISWLHSPKKNFFS